MAYSKSKEEWKWKQWKEKEEEQLRLLGMKHLYRNLDAEIGRNSKQKDDFSGKTIILFNVHNGSCFSGTIGTIFVM